MLTCSKIELGELGDAVMLYNAGFEVKKAEALLELSFWGTSRSKLDTRSKRPGILKRFPPKVLL